MNSLLVVLHGRFFLELLYKVIDMDYSVLKGRKIQVLEKIKLLFEGQPVLVKHYWLVSLTHLFSG